VRKFWLVLFQVLFLINVSAVVLTACSTNNSEDGFGDELNSELDDMDGGSLDDADVADTGDTKTADEAEGDITADNNDDFSDENFGDDGGKKTADAGSPSDSEFAAEDAPAKGDSAAAGTDTPSATDDLAEKDLQNELGKGGAPKEAPTAIAGTNGQVQQNDQIVPYPDEPTAPAANLPEGLKADPNEAAVVAASAKDVTVPNSAGVTTGTITAKDNMALGGDPFDQITSGPAVPNEDIGVSDPLVAEVDPPLPSKKAAQEVVQVSKVEKEPFFKNERLMNTVYIARPGDDLASISHKIFNEDRVGMLRDDNPHVAKGVEAGDKIYYNSPNRPDDKKAVLSFYEDNKMAPTYYVTKKGDDIQKIGRQVLGFEDGWKEVWAVNDSLQTQAMLPSGLKLRYWTGNEMKMHDPAPAPAATEMPAPQPMAAKEPQPEQPIDLPPSEPAALPAEDPGLKLNNDPAPMPSETAATAPTIENPDKDNAFFVYGGLGIAVLGIGGMIAIQVKNRKRGAAGGMPPSLDFNKV